MKKKYKAKKRFPWFNYFVLFFLIFTLYFFLFSPVFSLRKIKINSSLFSIQEIIEQNINQRIGPIVSNNIFLLNKKKTNQKLEKIVEIESFQIKRKLPNTLIVSAKERKVALVCCLQDNCFKIDQQGVVFKKTEKRSILICPLLKIGDKAMEEKTVVNILQIKKDLSDLLGFLHFQNNSLTLETNEGWRIFFNLQEDILDQIFRLKITLDEVVLETEKLDYIDLRFGETVYFK